MFTMSEEVKDHFYYPRNMGTFVDLENVYTVDRATSDNTAVMQLQVKYLNGVIVAAKFKTFGCPACIAVTSLITELLTNKTLEEAKMITSETLINALKLPREKYYCALLGEDLITKLQDIAYGDSKGKL